MAYTNTTLATLKTRLAERYDGAPFWTPDQARRAINEGLRIWNLITGTWRGSSTNLNLVPDDPYLFVMGTLLKAAQVFINGVVLTQTSLFALDHGVNNWEGARTNSGGLVPATTSFWAPVGLTEIAVYPAQAAPTIQAIVVDGVVATPILVNDGDFLNLGDEEINTLLGYALHVLSFARGAEAIVRTKPLRIEFYKAAAARNAVFAASSLYRKLIGLDRTRFAQPMQKAPSAEEQAMLGGVVSGGG